jgi:hypothetical protein
MPNTLTDVVLHRFDQLAPSGLMLLKCAAVFAEAFHVQELHCFADIVGPANTVAHNLRELLQAHLLRHVGNGIHTFAQAVLRDTAYELWPATTRAKLHARVAASLLHQLHPASANSPCAPDATPSDTDAGLSEATLSAMAPAGSSPASPKTRSHDLFVRENRQALLARAERHWHLAGDVPHCLQTRSQRAQDLACMGMHGEALALFEELLANPDVARSARGALDGLRQLSLLAMGRAFEAIPPVWPRQGRKPSSRLNKAELVASGDTVQGLGPGLSELASEVQLVPSAGCADEEAGLWWRMIELQTLAAKANAKAFRKLVAEPLPHGVVDQLLSASEGGMHAWLFCFKARLYTSGLRTHAGSRLRALKRAMVQLERVEECAPAALVLVNHELWAESVVLLACLLRLAGKLHLCSLWLAGREGWLAQHSAIWSTVSDQRQRLQGSYGQVILASMLQCFAADDLPAAQDAFARFHASLPVGWDTSAAARGLDLLRALQHGLLLVYAGHAGATPPDAEQRRSTSGALRRALAGFHGPHCGTSGQLDLLTMYAASLAASVSFAL